ncbi:hypothetical protein L1987_30933 [Smallanthus sonchifolius]|uniref:Uncharacterized protein n=1 Tax=Smallanthus sonchifolius TaxID=185202 RepID=A0ACB9I5Z2_9ASTR|nr:hypothetical protein L1987_30933 [Smallanthus sonchifolius]
MEISIPHNSQALGGHQNVQRRENIGKERYENGLEICSNQGEFMLDWCSSKRDGVSRCRRCVGVSEGSDQKEREREREREFSTSKVGGEIPHMGSGWWFSSTLPSPKIKNPWESVDLGRKKKADPENVSGVTIPIVGAIGSKSKAVIGPEACRSIIPKQVFERWENILLTSSECPNCHRLFCAQCKVAWHCGMSCIEFQSLKKRKRSSDDTLLTNLAKNKKCTSFLAVTSFLAGDLEKRFRQTLGDAKTDQLLSNGGNDYLTPAGNNDSILYPYTHEQYVRMVIGNLTDVFKPVCQTFEQDGQGTLATNSQPAQSATFQETSTTRREGFRYAKFDLYTEVSKRMKIRGPLRGIYSCGGKRGVQEFELCDDVDHYDYFHPNEVASSQYAELFWNGGSNVTTPYNLKTLFQLNKH